MDFGNIRRGGGNIGGPRNPYIPGAGVGGGGQLPNIPYGGMNGGGAFNPTPPTGAWGTPGGGLPFTPGRGGFDWGNPQKGIGGGPLMPSPYAGGGAGGNMDYMVPGGTGRMGDSGMDGGQVFRGPGIGGGPFLNPINPGMGGMGGGMVPGGGGPFRGPGTPGGPFNPYLPGSGMGGGMIPGGGMTGNPWEQILRMLMFQKGGGAGFGGPFQGPPVSGGPFTL